jgi:hypothetical protein
VGKRWPTSATSPDGVMRGMCMSGALWGVSLSPLPGQQMFASWPPLLTGKRKCQLKITLYGE